MICIHIVQLLARLTFTLILALQHHFFHYKTTSHVHLFEWGIIMHMLCRIDWMQSYKNVEPVRPFYIIVATYTFSTTKSKNIPNHNCNAAMVARPEADFGQGHKHTTHTRTHRCTQKHTHMHAHTYHTRKHTPCNHAHTSQTCACWDPCMWSYLYNVLVVWQVFSFPLMYIHTQRETQTHRHKCTHTHTHTHTYTHAHSHVHAHAHAQTHTHIHTHTTTT